MSGNADKGGNQMTKDDSARIQSTQASGAKDMSADGFAARAQSAGDKDSNPSGGNAGGQSGGQKK